MEDIERVTPGQVDHNISFGGVVVGHDGLGMDWMTNEEIEKYGRPVEVIVVVKVEDYRKLCNGDLPSQVVGLIYTSKGKYLVSRNLGEPVVNLFDLPHLEL